MKITKREAIKLLKALKNPHDTEQAHLDADFILLRLINSKAVSNAYHDINKWYA